jgi:tetratricopeptide (TPR) repeat protein
VRIAAAPALARLAREMLSARASRNVRCRIFSKGVHFMRAVLFVFLFALTVALRTQAGEPTIADDASTLLVRGIETAARGDVAAAEASLARAAEAFESSATLTDAERSRYVSALNLRASLLHAGGRTREAEAVCRRALAASEAGRSPRDTADTLVLLAGMQLDRGERGPAEQLASRALKLWETFRGPADPEVARALSVLADVRASRGELTEADHLLRRAARAAESRRGSPAILAAVVARRGLLRLHAGRYADAEPLLEQGVELAEEALGPDHPALVRLTQTLADCYRLRNRPSDARPLYERSIAMGERLQGTAHVSLLPSLTGLMLVLERQDDLDGAAATHARALVIATEHPDRSTWLPMLAAFQERHRGRGPQIVGTTTASAASLP